MNRPPPTGHDDSTAVSRDGAVRVVVDGGAALLDGAERAPRPTELVVTPEQLHRRNLRRCLAERSQARSSIRLVDATDVAADLLAAAGRDPAVLDRIDRLRRLEALVDPDSGSSAVDHLTPVLGTDLSTHLSTVEAARTRVETMTGWRPARLDALRAVTDTLPGVVGDDATALVAGVVALEERLGESVGPTHARGGLLSAAATAVRDGAGDRWRETFPAVDRLTVAGVSTLDAPLIDLLGAVTVHTETRVTLSLRPGTGPAIAARLPTLLPDAVDVVDETDSTEGAAGESTVSAVPTTELVGETPSEEARVAMAVVARLVERGVSPGDVLVAARDADAVERRVRRAGRRHGLPVAVWTQLPVAETLPNRLFRAVGTLLRNERVDGESLLCPLSLGWVPPASGDADTTGNPSADARTVEWPTPHGRVERLRAALEIGGTGDDDEPATSPVADWNDVLADNVAAGSLAAADADPLRRLLAWVDDQPPAPAPADVHGTFEPLVERYRERVLPAALARDADDLQATAQHARAVVRWDELLGDVRAKYDDWLADGYADRSWDAVFDLVERIAATRPGRREHANAAAVDVVDATDAWLRSTPYVVAVGLVDGDWPEHPRSVFPTGLRTAVVEGASPEARRLAVPGRWTAGREVDHLRSAVDAASEHLVCTRHERRTDGTTAERSPYLDRIGATSSAENAVDRLLHEGALPKRLEASVGDRR